MELTTRSKITRLCLFVCTYSCSRDDGGKISNLSVYCSKLLACTMDFFGGKLLINDEMCTTYRGSESCQTIFGSDSRNG